MSSLPETEITLQGGCFCNAIEYQINIPPAISRPLIPGALALSTATKAAAEEAARATHVNEIHRPRWPNIELDHCGSCRRACGSLVQAWIVIPLDWVTFTAATKPHISTYTGPLNVQDPNPPVQQLNAIDIVRPSSALIEKTYIGSYSSNSLSWRTFCTRCGTGLTFFYSSADGQVSDTPVMDIALGTLRREHLDQPWMKPQRHCHWDSGVSWVKDMLYSVTGPIPRHPRGLPTALVEEDQWMLPPER